MIYYIEVPFDSIYPVCNGKLTPCILAGEAGVCGLEGGVIGLGNLNPLSCLREAGEPIEGCWDMLNTSTASMTIGDGGLSSSVVDILRVCNPVTESSTFKFRNAWKKINNKKKKRNKNNRSPNYNFMNQNSFLFLWIKHVEHLIKIMLKIFFNKTNIMYLNENLRR